MIFLVSESTENKFMDNVADVTCRGENEHVSMQKGKNGNDLIFPPRCDGGKIRNMPIFPGGKIGICSFFRRKNWHGGKMAI